MGSGRGWGKRAFDLRTEDEKQTASGGEVWGLREEGLADKEFDD
jgi:hypothetical protein